MSDNQEYLPFTVLSILLLILVPHLIYYYSSYKYFILRHKAGYNTNGSHSSYRLLTMTLILMCAFNIMAIVDSLITYH